MKEPCPYNIDVLCEDARTKFGKQDCRACSHWNWEHPINQRIMSERFAQKTWHGHPKFYQLLEEERELHNRKNHDYSCGGDPLGNFRRVASILSLYPNLTLSNPAVVALVYAMKQLDATLWLLSNGHEAKVEGFKERLQDVSVYSKIISILLEEKG